MCVDRSFRPLGQSPAYEPMPKSYGRMAEREGFEPSIRFCRILTFQASAFDHSATAPHALESRPLEAHGRRGKLAASDSSPLWLKAMARRFDHPPSTDEIEAIARDAMQ